VEKPFTVKKHWDAAVEAAGIENFRFHDCRHTAASWLINEGVGDLTVGKTLGHRSLQSTARYAHLDVKAVKAAVDRVMTSERLGGGSDPK
jgi:integrase